MALYLLYNADPLQWLYQKKEVEARGYTFLIATGKMTRGNNQKLAKVQNSVYEDWKTNHGIQLF